MFTQTQINDLVFEVKACAIEVHRTLGPGLLESIYEECMCIELDERGIKYERQKKTPVFYKGHKTAKRLRLDILIEGVLVCEIKSVDAIHPVFKAQLLTYMEIIKAPKGIIINFNGTNIINNTVQMVNEYFRQLDV
jgi:GxxExxY protein